MKKTLRKVVAVFLAAIFALSLVSCAKQEDIKFNLVLITDGSPVDNKEMVQEVWEGVREYGSSNDNINAKYYQPVTDENGIVNAETYSRYIKLAVDNGAEYIVCPGEALAVAVYENASLYPDVKFILVDAMPHAEGEAIPHYIKNVMTVNFDTMQSGFLAGYEAVKRGHTELGFFGSIASNESSDYGAGFVQGASYASQEDGVPVVVDFANYDAQNLDFDYTTTIKAVYEKISDQKESTFKVVVENGTGSGVYFDGENITLTANPAPEGKVFDKWVCKSNTDGVKDSQISITASEKTSTDLYIDEADCTITATYKDAGEATYKLDVTGSGSGYYKSGAKAEVKAASSMEEGMVFDCWSVTGDCEVEDLNSAETTVKMGSQDAVLTAQYKESDVPTFNVIVEGGSGTGCYTAGETVDIVADEPADGYMFSHWENTDCYGENAGIACENEYYFQTSFEMPDRLEALAYTMYNKGVTCVFGAGSTFNDSVFNATTAYDYTVNAIGSDYNQDSKDNCIFTARKEYAVAIQNAIKEFKGGSVYTASCSNNGVGLSDKDFDEQLTKDYKAVYDKLAGGEISITPVAPGADVSIPVQSNKAITVNFRIAVPEKTETIKAE